LDAPEGQVFSGFDMRATHSIDSDIMNRGPLQAVDALQADSRHAVHGVDSLLQGFENLAQPGVGNPAPPIVDSQFLRGIDSTIQRAVEGFAPATIEESAELDPPKGQYRTDESRETATPVAESYMYRPAADTGSNDFQRFGPQMDKKVDSFRYYA
jgi:hypothetical protein